MSPKWFIRTLLVFGYCLASIGIATSCKAGESRTAGVWGAGHVAYANVTCIQTWVCKTPAIITPEGAEVSDTPDENMSGVCTTGSGSGPAGCGACVSSPPATTCERVATWADEHHEALE